jgi:monothiol glutaredoxin
MPRPILEEAKIHPAVRAEVAKLSPQVAEVQAAIAAHPLVVVGMGLNPFPRKARRLLDAAGMPYHYLSYGNYFNNWRERNTLKLWSGWRTFPMVFVRGTLVGGANDVQRLLNSGELQQMLNQK